MLHGSHIIQQQDIEIHFDHFADGITVQQEISNLFYEDLLPKMQTLFDGLTGSTYTISIERLDIDCGMLNHKHWKTELVDQTLRRLRDELSKMDKKENKKRSLNAFESFLFFLSEGHLTWNSRVQRKNEMINAMVEDIMPAQNPELFRNLLRSNPASAERLLNNFPADFLWQIIQWLRGVKETNLKTIRNDQETMKAWKKGELRSLLTEAVSENDTGQPVSSLTGKENKNPASTKADPPKKEVT